MKKMQLKLRVPRLGPAGRVALGLSSMVVGCILVLDLFFNIFPDQLKEVRVDRAELSQKLAAQAASLVNSEGSDVLSVAMRTWVQHNPQLLSIAVRGDDGRLVAQSGEHGQFWNEPEGGRSTLEHVMIPLMQAGSHWGTFEASFTPAGPSSIWQWLLQPWPVIILTLGVGGFVLFSLYLRRVFEYLDPQSVLPDRIRAAFDAFSEGVMVVDPGGRIILANSVIRKWVGKDGPSMNGRSIRKIDVLNAGLPARSADHPWMKAMQQRSSVRGSYIEIDSAEGNRRKLTVNCSPVLDDDGGVRGCIATFDDVTEIENINRQLVEALEELKASREEVEARNLALQEMAMRDSLTGSLNRRAFFDAAIPAFNEARARQDPLSCVMVDIDYFKSFNDRFGHAVGDEVLKVTSRILAGGVRNGDVLCRYGGEEFCILMPRTGIDEAKRVAEQLRQTIEMRAARAVSSLHSVNVTASFGIAELADQESCEELMDNADQALYVAKEEGRNRVKLHDVPESAMAS
jgi:diguanylate cyclase (GGDEF)-like protein/PAS domain S-box-containing protein